MQLLCAPRKPQYCYCASSALENSSSQAHTFSFLFHTELYYYYRAETAATLRIPKSWIQKQSSMEREKTERKVGLLLSLTFVRPTIGVEPCFVVYTYFHYRLERDFKRSHTLHECKEQLYGVQALYTTTIKCAIKCLIVKLTLHLFTLKCLAIFRRLLENT